MSLINVNSHAYNNNDNRNHNNTTPSSGASSKQEEAGSKPVAKEKKQNPDTNWFHFAFRVVFNMPLPVCSYIALQLSLSMSRVSVKATSWIGYRHHMLA